MKSFRGKTVLITGAASGIGRSLAENLSLKGARLILADLNTRLLDEVTSVITRKGGTASGNYLDVTKETDFKKLIDDVVRDYGHLDCIFNNAGIGLGGEVRDIGYAEWESVLKVNLNGVIYGSIHAYQAMVKQGFGHIVNIASLEGLIPFPFTVPYITSKYAVIGLSNGMRVEGAPLGVDVSVVCPGFIRTPIFESPVINLDREAAMKSLPMVFSISPDECARRILKGVARNKAIIPVTGLTRVLWWLARISPAIMIWLVTKNHSRTVDRIRLKQTG